MPDGPVESQDSIAASEARFAQFLHNDANAPARPQAKMATDVDDDDDNDNNNCDDDGDYSG